VPSAAPTVSAASLAHGEVIFEDDFTDPGLWTLTDDSVYKTAVTGGQFVFTIKAADQYGFVFSSKRRASDFVASLSATAAACKFRDRYGLLFRVANLSNYYQFDVDCDGAYRLSKVVDGRLTPLQNWMKNEAVNRGSGAQNELAVRANGKNIEVFVNGVSLRALTDVTFSEGGFGIYAGSGLSETYTAQFEQLNVWKVK
jgi:hypothetical protein